MRINNTIDCMIFGLITVLVMSLYFLLRTSFVIAILR